MTHLEDLRHIIVIVLSSLGIGALQLEYVVVPAFLCSVLLLSQCGRKLCVCVCVYTVLYLYIQNDCVCACVCDIGMWWM